MTDATATKTSAVEKLAVVLTDGRTAHFGKKNRLIKTTTIDEETGVVRTVLDFVNGETRTFEIPSALILRFAAHGAEQKLGDAMAGETDLADAVLAVDDTIKHLLEGEWNAKREAGAFTGTSVLIQALVEASGKSIEDIKAFLADKTQAQKLALRKSNQLKPIIERIEAEKAKTSKTKVDTGALLAGLGIDEPAVEEAPAPKAKK